MNYTLKNSKTEYEGKIVDVKTDEIDIEGKDKSQVREVVVHPGGAAIVAVTPEKKILFVTQYRYAVQTTLFELPAGKLDGDEDPQECAVRELKEETGYIAGKVEKLGKIFTSPGFASEVLHLYYAGDLKKGDPNREEGEADMEVYELTFDEVNSRMVSGDIEDAKTLGGLSLFFNRRDLH